MVESWIEYTVDKEPIVVYPVGTRVRHRRCTGVEGVIKRHERHESGAISPLPFYIDWDDKDFAYVLLGSLNWYASADDVEVIG